MQSLPVAEVAKRLGSSPDGLSQAEAQKRLAQYGPNEIAEHKTNPLLKFLTYFWGPIPWMIEVAVILSGAVGHWPDFFIILVLLVVQRGRRVLGGAPGGQRHRRAEGQAGDQRPGRRDGKWVTPPARELVPGDVIRLRLGDIVPADARLLDGDPVEVDQSALTGESLPATRKPGDAVFSGSIIRRGEIGALVYATGAHTYFGKTAELVQEAHTVSHFQTAVLKIGNYLIILAVALVAVIVAVSLAARRPDPHHAAVRAGADRRRDPGRDADGAVGDDGGRRAAAGQEDRRSSAGWSPSRSWPGVDVLCADKTGTLTQNTLTLGDPFSVDDVTADDVILDGALASRADNDDPIDLAVLGGLTRRPGAAGLPGRPLPAVRPGAQTHRGHRHRRRRDHVQGHARAPRRSSWRWPPTPTQVEGRRRHGGQRLRRPRLPLPRRGPRRRRRRLAVPRRAAAVRPAPRGRQGDHRHRPARWA